MSNSRKQIYFTSDWHCFHENSIIYDKRPFNDLDHMHRVLINNYNATVPKDGLCYFLGDIGFCSSDKLKSIISQLNGTKILILGNHDKQHNAMYGMGFDCVLNSACLWIAGQKVTMSHCPIKGVYRENTEGMKGALPGESWHGEHRLEQYTVQNEGQFHLHGHVHSPNNGRSKRIEGRQFDIGVVANRYTPVSISEIESFISKTLKNGR